MEDDDEFGDLYTDVLRPLTTTSFQTQHQEQPPPASTTVGASSQSRPIDLNINSDDDEILYGAGPALSFNNYNNDNNSNPKSNSVGLNSNLDETLPESRGFDLNLDSNDRPAGDGGEGLEFKPRALDKDKEAVLRLPQKATGASNFIRGDEDDDIDIVLDERENRDDDFVEKDSDFMDTKENMEESRTNFVDETVVGEVGVEQMIPGLSGNNNRGLEEEWESEDSEDDLQIVLNDNRHGPMGMDRMMGLNDEDEDDDEDEQELVIVADNGDAGNQVMETQDWAGDEGGPGADGERKELGDAAKPGGGPAALAAVQPKVAYGGHAYHNSFHSQFKYVRPGAAPIPGAAPVPSAGMPGQVRPPVTMSPAAGRGRGDWRPAGVRGTAPVHKGLQSGSGLPAWGLNAAGRGYGSGLDFTLPSHKTIFEVDIDSFEEKPWRLSGIDTSDFFNFGLDEESWKDYCKQLEQLRLATTMQSKIRVYESGRAEQDYDPDLPPELAAAGIQDIPSDNANSGKAYAGTIDLARSSVHGRPPLPVGRPIPVEAGSGDRLPSINTRRPRMHDTDAIIEIFCHSSSDDDDMADQQDNDSSKEHLGGGDGSDDLLQDDAENADNLSPAYNDRKREAVERRTQSKKTVGNKDISRMDELPSPPQAPGEYLSGSENGVSDEERSTKRRGRARSAEMTAPDNKREKFTMDDQNEESFVLEDAKQDAPLSSPPAIESGQDEALVVGDDMNDESAMDDISIDMDGKGIDVDGTTRISAEDDNLMNSVKKQKLSSHAEQVSKESESREDSKASRSSENSKGRSGSSTDNRRFIDNIEDEVVHDRRPPRAVDTKRLVEDVDIARRKGSSERDETERHHKVMKGREDSYSRGGGDHSSSLRWNVRSGSADRRKESDMSEGSWNWREEDHHATRFRVEEPNRDHGGEMRSRNRDKARDSERSEKDEYHQSRNQLDNGSRRVVNHDHQYMRSRQRDMDEIPKSRNERVDDLRSKRRKEEVHLSREYRLKEDISYNYIESGPRKRERDDGPDLRRRDDQARLKDGNVHFVGQKEEASFQRERTDRRRQSDDWHRVKQEEMLSRREREDTQSLMRSSRAAEDKTWISHSRGKDDYRVSGRQYHPKDVGRNEDQLRRRDPVGNEDFSQHRDSDDIYACGNQLSNDEKSARYERRRTRNEHVAHTSDASGPHERKQKESNRKGKGSESGHQGSLVRSRKNQDVHSGQISEMVNSKGRMEQQSGENDMHVNRQSSRKHHKEEERSLDDEQAADSRKGRSKLERWTSHKERDFTSSIPSSSLKTKDVDKHNNRGEEPSKKIEEESQPLVDGKEAAAEMNNNNNNVCAKVTEDKHLDTVEKLKKRSERFKLPLPSERDPVAIKKMESEPLPSAHADTHAGSEIKSERPPRKRRWTGN